jgi:putative hydrolase of the HAD superfamily
MARIKNFFIDFSEVFANGMYWGGEMGRLVQERLGISVDEFRKKDTGESWELWKKLNRGHLDEVEYWELIVRTHAWDIKPEEFIQCTYDAMKIEIPGTLQVVRELSQKGYRLFLISDVWRKMSLAMEAQYPWLLELFEHRYYSFETGEIKSDPDYFEEICRDADVNPAESLFIDDYDVNVNRAREAGLQGIVFENAAQLRTELERGLGI